MNQSLRHRVRPPTAPPQTVVEPVGAAGAEERPKAAWSLARTVLTAVFCASGVVALLEVWQTKTGLVRLGIAAVLMACLLAIQLLHFSRPGTELRSPRGYLLLALLACLAYAPLLVYGWPWTALPPFLAGCVLLMLPPVAAWTSFAVIMASLWAIRVALHETPIVVAYYVLDSVLFGLYVFLLTKLAALVAELHTARHELAQLAVAEERLRFARDLHDLLGLSLSAITLKGELTHRLVTRAPERAKQELAEILDIARRALADVRSVASGYRELSLDKEVSSAESVLRASDVDVRMDVRYRELPARERTLLGMVLREGVTNVLRHSTATHCEIVIRQTATAAILAIRNDGVRPPDADPEPNSGNGLRNLSARVAALDGEVVAGPGPDGRFELHVRVPLAARHAPNGQAGRFTRSASQTADTASPSGTWTTTVLVGAVFTGLAGTAVIHLLMLTRDFWTVVSGTAYLAALLGLQLGYFSRPTIRRHTVTGYLLLLAQACLTYLPLLQLGNNWVSLPGWLGGNALLLLRPVAGWAVFAATVGSMIWRYQVVTGHLLDIMFYAAATIITGLVAFGLTSLTKVIAELHTIRKQLATMAVAEERLRFARDLHDLLGLSLSAITLKCELTNRLLTSCPEQAAAELTDILGLARQALADTRSVASGARDLSLDEESRSAESVLTAADVTVRMDLDHHGLPARVRTVLAVVLREGVTNVLRHSTAEQCDITLRKTTDRVTLTIVNDGAAAPDHDRIVVAGGAGSGIRNLAGRVTELGGEIDCGPAGDGRYRLRVSVPT